MRCALVKNFTSNAGGQLKLQSENPDYDDVTVSIEEEIEIIGRVRDKSGRGGL